jgi:hypothetical protein
MGYVRRASTVGAGWIASALKPVRGAMKKSRASQGERHGTVERGHDSFHINFRNQSGENQMEAFFSWERIWIAGVCL